MGALLGAHVGIGGGLQNAFVDTAKIEAETIQIFTRNQRQWTAKPITPEEAATFKAAWKESAVQSVIVHGSYLVNLAAADEKVLERSRDGFRAEVERCQALGVDALVFHPGAHVGAGEDAGIERIVESIRVALDGVPMGKTKLLFENTAGQGTVVGHTLEQLTALLDGVGDRKRFGVCIDTQHTFAAGYDLRTREAYAKTMEAIDAAFGLDRIHAFHLNDSKSELGSRVDRHEFIGKGKLGGAAFWNLMHDDRFDGIPMALEVPIDETEDYAKDLKVLRQLTKDAKPPKDSWFVE